MEKGFKSLIAWQKAYGLVLDIYQMTKNFPKSEQYALVSQMRRAAVSVISNIAEGYERKHRKEYIQFLMIAKGSSGEIESYFLLSRDLKYINGDEHICIEMKRQEVIKLLRGLIRYLNPNH